MSRPNWRMRIDGLQVNPEGVNGLFLSDISDLLSVQLVPQVTGSRIRRAVWQPREMKFSVAVIDGLAQANELKILAARKANLGVPLWLRLYQDTPTAEEPPFAISGTITAIEVTEYEFKRGNEKLTITFLPRDAGGWSRYYDFTNKPAGQAVSFAIPPSSLPTNFDFEVQNPSASEVTGDVSILASLTQVVGEEDFQNTYGFTDVMIAGKAALRVDTASRVAISEFATYPVNYYENRIPGIIGSGSYIFERCPAQTIERTLTLRAQTMPEGCTFGGRVGVSYAMPMEVVSANG